MKDERISTEDVWALLSSKLRSFIRSRVANDQIAADLLQETFLRIHKRIDDLQNQDRIEAWVFQIARNLIMDHYRTSERGGNTIDVEPSVEREQNNINEQVAGWLPLMIELLPETYREAVRLYEIDGLEQQEIADRLGLSLSGAKSRVQRGREQLRRMLNDCCVFEVDRRGNVLDYERNQEGNCCDLDDNATVNIEPRT